MPGACPTTLTLTLTLTKEHPQGYLSCEEGPLYTPSLPAPPAYRGHELEVT